MALAAALLVAVPQHPAGADGNEAPGAPERFRALTAGAAHTCALRSDGAVRCWGGNIFGRLGLGDAANRGDDPGEMGAALPTVNLGPGRTATAIAAGAAHTCAILDTGQVKCWGYDFYGQLGIGATDHRGDDPGEMGAALPTVDLGTGRTATAIAAGLRHTCAILDTDQVKCWGNNNAGQLGLGDTTDRGDGPSEMGDALPAVPLGTGRTATAITAGDLHTCALLDNGQLKCWGDGGNGRLGLGDDVTRGDGPGEMGDALPAVPLGTGRTATAVTAGSAHTCALLDNAQVKCWGANGSGQLGQGDTFDYGSGPLTVGDFLSPVSLGSGRTATAVTADFAHTCALLDDQTVKCWGENGSGQLGQGDPDDRGDQSGEMGDALDPIADGNGRTAIAVTTSGQHTCALLDNSRLKCWGGNFAGRLGLGDVNDRGNDPGEMGDALPAVDLAPRNDPFAQAEVLTGSSGTRTGANDEATKQAGEPSHHGQPAATTTIWYRWTAPNGGRANIDTVNSGFDTVLAVYTGSTVNSLTFVASDDDTVSNQSRVRFNAVGGVTYRIAVAGFDGATGPVVLHWRVPQPCAGRAVTVDVAMGDTATAGADVIRGTASDNTINGLGGADTICGGGGADTIRGGTGSGADRLYGESGADAMLGGSGNDVLSGGSQNDALFGQAGADTFNGGANRDSCNGGSQVDTATNCETRSGIP
jgi:alpha-tubulin suppressor-like RCC1 family protein